MKTTEGAASGTTEAATVPEVKEVAKGKQPYVKNPKNARYAPENAKQQRMKLKRRKKRV